jgi:hypothetical protein
MKNLKDPFGSRTCDLPTWSTLPEPAALSRTSGAERNCAEDQPPCLLAVVLSAVRRTVVLTDCHVRGLLCGEGNNRMTGDLKVFYCPATGECRGGLAHIRSPRIPIRDTQRSTACSVMGTVSLVSP